MKSLLTIICIFNFNILLSCGKKISVEDVVGKSIEEVKPHHCILWTNLFDGVIYNSQHLKSHQRFLKNLLSKVPTTQMSINKPTSFTPGFYLYDVNISAPIHYFYFIAQDHGKNDARKIIDVIVKIFNSIMHMSVPKFLLVIHQRRSFSPTIKEILRIARLDNYVDFVVLQVIQNKPPVLFRNNFVSGKIEVQNNASLNSKLFPDYFQHLKEYNLRVGVPYDWSSKKKGFFLYPARLEPNSRLDKLYEYFAESLNVTTTFAIVDSPIRNENIKKHNVEMVLDGNDIAFGIWNFNNIYILRYSKVQALVPLIEKTEIKASKNILYSFLILAAIIIGLFLFFKYSRYSAAGWSWLNIFQLMLGNSVNVQLPNLSAKLAYGFLLAISLFFITDLVSDLTSINYENKKVLLADSVDEILQKKLAVCTPHNKEVFKILSEFCTDKQREVLNINKDCTNIKENEIMIAFELIAEMRQYQNQLDDIDNSKVEDMGLPIIINAVFFRENSVFRTKFSIADSRFREFGLDVKWALDLKVRRLEKKGSVIDTDDDALVRSLILILLVGWGIAITVFLLELAWYHILSKFNLIVLEE